MRFAALLALLVCSPALLAQFLTAAPEKKAPPPPEPEETPAAPVVVVAPVPVTVVTPAAPAAAEEDDEDDEIVIRRKKKKKPAPAPVVVAPVAVPQPPPPPEPSAEDAAEPRRLVRYFCKVWKDEDYERMWWAMTPAYRKQTKLKKFTKLFTDDKEMNGGLVDENILVSDAALPDGTVQVTVDLRYKFKRVGVRRVKAVLEKKGPQYRLCESSIIPLDLSDL